MPKQQLRVDVPQEIRSFQHSFSENECFVLRREKIHIHPRFSNGYKRDEVTSSMPAEMLEISSVNAWSKGKGFAIEFYSELKSRWEREGERLNLPVTIELSFEDHWYKLSEDEPTIRQLSLKMTDIYQSFRIDYRVNSQKSFLSEKTPEIVVTANGYELYHKEKFYINDMVSRMSKKGRLISLGYQSKDKDSDGELWRTIWYWYHFVLPAEVGQKLMAMLRT